MKLPQDMPSEIVAFVQEAGYLDEDRLVPGDSVPELILHRLEGGEAVTIGGRNHRPVVLIFGSYT